MIYLKINILKNKENKLIADIKGTSVQFMNAIRRISMIEVPVLAIEEVHIEENSSVMFDEIIAQRLGQVPLKFDPHKFNFKDRCECEGEGCPNCEFVFTLEKTGGMVYSRDLSKASAGDVEVLYPNIPLVFLEENQTVKLEAVAVLGTGKDHSKFQASIPSYKNYPKITIDGRKLKEGEGKKIIEACPKDIFKGDSGKPKIENPEECILCKECVEAAKSGAVNVEESEDRFILKIESISGLKPEDILIKSAKILEEKGNEVIGKIE